MKYHAAIEQEILPFAATCVNADIILHEMSQTRGLRDSRGQRFSSGKWKVLEMDGADGHNSANVPNATELCTQTQLR